MAENVVPRRQYTKEFKVEAVRLAESVGQHEAARRLGVPVATLGNWCRDQRDGSAQAAAGPVPSAPSSNRRPVSDLEAENSRLRKELASAKLDIEILRKATAYFAKGAR
ncbi:transposase [Burkholderia stagnalis]|nr:transposase [Burkholderia stagnalis]